MANHIQMDVASLQQFMVTPPTCLSKVPGGVTTMHIFFTTNTVTGNTC